LALHPPLALYFRANVPHFMRRMRFTGFAVLLLALALNSRAATNAMPDFNEVYGLIRAHLAGITEAELNQAAVEGLLSALRGKVSFVGEGVAVSNTPALASASLLESNIAYIRLAALDDGLPAKLTETMGRWSSTNPPAGLVLDLRFAASEDYPAAAGVADLFQSNVRPLLHWGGEVLKSREKPDAIRCPVAVLVNRETVGAAEALAAILRDTGVALILGNPTAGGAMIGQEFPLKDGRKLRVATLPLKIGEGVELSARGLSPDIAVRVSPTEERTYLGDPYGAGKATDVGTGGFAATGSVGATNRPARRSRPSEADLVRARREGVNLDENFLDARAVEPPKPWIRDPALARAVDLIKGLAVVRAAKS
jgi:Peptidase family S41